MHRELEASVSKCRQLETDKLLLVIVHHSVIFVNENENENGEKQENNEFVNEN